jgi:hypothetical protein
VTLLDNVPQLISDLFIESVWESEETAEPVTQIYLTTTSDCKHLLFCLFFKDTSTVEMMVLQDTSTFLPYAKLTSVAAVIPLEAYSKSVSFVGS